MADDTRDASNQPAERWAALSTDRRRFLIAGGAPLLGLLGGCMGSSGSASSDISTPVPQIAAIPYTASNDDENVGTARALTIWNNTEGERQVRVTIVDSAANVLFYRRDHTIEPGAEPRFDDLMAKKTTYRITFDWDIGLRKSYDWPVDEDHWHARGTIGVSGDNFSMTFRVQPL